MIELHKSPNLIPPYLHNERVPVVHCVYDARAVGFHRHIDNGEDAPSIERTAKLDEAPPETDQLGDGDITRLTNQTRRGLRLLRHKFVRPNRRLAFMEMFDTDEEEEALVDSEDEFEVDDLDEEDDMELDMELDEEDDFMDDEGMQFFEHNGEFYVTMWETASEDEDEEEVMHDAVELQEAQNFHQG